MKGKMYATIVGRQLKGVRAIHRIKQYLAHARGQIEPCPKVSADLKVEMLGLIESFQTDKAKTENIKKDIGRSRIDESMRMTLKIMDIEMKLNMSLPLALVHQV
jgi:hypothetical protein